MQSPKPQYTLEVFDAGQQICTSTFELEQKRGILSRTGWLNVSAVENLTFTVRPASGEPVKIDLASGRLKEQASSERFTVTINGTQGFNRRNVAFTARLSPKKREAAE